MAALVQTITQPVATVSMLQTRPASSSSAATFSHQRAGSSRSGNIIQYRAGGSVSQPLNQIPANNQTLSRQNPSINPRFEHRSMSAPGDAPTLSSVSSKANESSESYLKAEPNRMSLLSAPLDLSLTDPRSKNHLLSSRNHNSMHSKSPGNDTSLTKPLISGSAFPDTSNTSSSSTSPSSNLGLSRDDTAISQLSGIAQKYRRRSIATKDNADSQPASELSVSFAPTRSWASVVSTPYDPSKPESRPLPSCNTLIGTNTTVPSALEAEVSGLKSPTSSQEPTTSKSVLRVINVPPRGSSDATKRLANPSPLSKPLSAEMDEPAMQSSSRNPVSDRPLETQPQSLPPSTESPAQQQLTSLSKKDGKKDGKSSRLRRAFSFGSAAELRKASAENNHANTTRKLQKPQYENEEEAREAAIVKQQEAAGLGNSIYSGQGNVFAGSTDNLSVSSTASSASIMLRKMGKGMKKGTRSLVGLFRPKSIIGAPVGDSIPEMSTAQVSMVTAEAERENMTPRPKTSDHAGIENSFPKIELGSLDTFDPTSYLKLNDRDTEDIKSRKSIVGNEKDRAEVLAAVKKGILKRVGTDSGSASPTVKSPDQVLLEMPQSNRPDGLLRSGTSDGPGNSAPRGHRRTDSVTIEGEDYFIPMGRFQASDSKSLPGTPRGIARNISFSPRIQFHDTWTANDYDRRSETATCNRLTPSLAQAIKEELNSFKMEMEVHESSKMYTHFF